MSPIIELQRRMVEVGRIRAGDKGDKGQPRKLAEWRLTSKDRRRLEAAAQMWGGEVRDWNGHDGEHELYTNTAELPIMLIPGQMPTTWYELWSKGGCQRRCDGVHELISDSSCLCGEDRECKPITRLSVMLPDLAGVGSWLVASTGWNAAAELTGAAALLGHASSQGKLIPARLRLEQRVSVKEGQTRRFAVPVIDIDVSVRELLGISPPIVATLEERGYTPLAPIEQNGPTVAQALVAVEQQQPHRGPKSPPALPVVEDVPFAKEPVPVTEEMPGGVPGPTHTSAGAGLGDNVPAPAPPGAGGDANTRSESQEKKLNVLVGRLRDAGALTTEHVWMAVASLRSIEMEAMAELLGGRDSDGVLHWSPLRESLSKAEASNLIDRLDRYEAHVQAAQAEA